jgi:hypothetical protein
MAACVVHEAAHAAGTKIPPPATKNKGRAICPILHRKPITAAFPSGFLENERSRNGPQVHISWMQAMGPGQTPPLN